MSAFLVQLRTPETVIPIRRGDAALEPLAEQLRASGLDGQLEVIHLPSGTSVIRLPLDSRPEEGDVQQPYPAA